MEIKDKNSILEAIRKKENWEEFLAYKTERRHVDKREQKLLTEYIENEKNLMAYEQMKEGTFRKEYDRKKDINKFGIGKKRVGYSF